MKPAHEEKKSMILSGVTGTSVTQSAKGVDQNLMTITYEKNDVTISAL